MQIPEAGRRERKKAASKIELMNQLLYLLEERALGEITVEQVCAAVGISKVTFFNYFDSKEQVLEYFVHRWQFETAYVIEREGLAGREALYRIFDTVGAHAAGGRVMHAVTLFFLKTENFAPMHISDYEYYLFNPDAFSAGVRPGRVGDLFAAALSSYHLPAAAVEHAVSALVAGFYGVPVRVKASAGDDLKQAYRHFVDAVIDGIGGKKGEGRR